LPAFYVTKHLHEHDKQIKSGIAQSLRVQKLDQKPTFSQEDTQENYRINAFSCAKEKIKNAQQISQGVKAQWQRLDV